MRKRATVTKFKGKLYCHFADQFSKKTITFNADELRKMKKILPSIYNMVKTQEKKLKKQKNTHETDMEEDSNASPYCTQEETNSSDSD